MRVVSETNNVDGHTTHEWLAALGLVAVLVNESIYGLILENCLKPPLELKFVRKPVIAMKQSPSLSSSAAIDEFGHRMKHYRAVFQLVGGAGAGKVY